MYVFYDTDKYGEEEYNISGNDYLELINTCIRYSKTVSFQIHDYYKNKVILPPCIEMCKIRSGVSSYTDAKVIYIKLSSEVCQWITTITDNIWGWLNYAEKALPEDITFYREDSSIFFSSTTHDGVCSLFPKEGEDVSLVVSKKHWKEEPDNKNFHIKQTHEQFIVSGNVFLKLEKGLIINTKNAFDNLKAGQNIEEVKQLDAAGDYSNTIHANTLNQFFSLHCTVDGYSVIIFYDENFNIEKIEYTPIIIKTGDGKTNQD